MGLTFKDGSSAGDYKKKASKKKKSSKSKSSSSSSSSAPTAASSSDPAAPVKQKGRGHIHPSGTVVTGMDTEFMQDLATGDALLVQNPNTLKDEMRIVQFIVSNTSLSVSSAFAFTTSSSVKYVQGRDWRAEGGARGREAGRAGGNRAGCVGEAEAR
jgi:hypothetical protein